MIDILISMWYYIYTRKRYHKKERNIKMKTVMEKRFILNLKERDALEVVSVILKDFIGDEELSNTITLESGASLLNALDLVSTILELDKAGN